MGVRLKRLPECGVVLEVFSGIITLELLCEHLSLLRSGDPPRFLIYFDPTADLTLLTVEEIAAFRNANAARLRELKFDDALIALVCAPGPNAQLIDFWCRYVQLDGDHPTTPALFSGLSAACAWLDLPEAVAEEIKANAAAETHLD